jgi:DNA invertase Pin-like site-specific DNA recombinase
MINHDKIQPQHTTKLAYIYLRQSTLGQVRFNQESTQRQYALQDKAQQMGWLDSHIKILDGDLGKSGAHAHQREDFKLLVADVSMGKVGAVFALEASRLSRSCTDWHRLLELCALTQTLIIDEDGCYNPADFNDQLLLGLKGTMSQAELHFIRARLQGGKINKAKKGELKFPLPVGFCYDSENRIALDPDEQVRNAVQLVFRAFKETGSAYGVVHYFRKHNLTFPKRAYGGIWKGKLVWGTLTHTRALAILKNPSYAGVYVYGRYQYQKTLSPTGQLKTTMVCLPMEAWGIVIRGHHEAYLSWEDYLAHQEMLKANRTNEEVNALPTAAREGLALLQGLLICGNCGHRLTVRYKGNQGIYPTYECSWKRREGLATTSCLAARGNLIDETVTKKMLAVMKPKHITIATQAFEEVVQRHQLLDKQWQMKIERAEYEAQLAQRSYEEVDPANRLVAATLEKRWDETLSTLNEIKGQYEVYKQKNTLALAQQQKSNLLALAKDLPHLWRLPSTCAKDRKRILRLLINDITVEKNNAEQKIILHIRWQGGATEDMTLPLPQKSCDRWRHSHELVDKVKTLAATMTDEQIVTQLNQEGLKTNKGNSFTLHSIRWIRFKHNIPSVRLQKPDELSINQVAQKFNVSHHVVRYWIERDMIKARKVASRLWVFLPCEKEAELKALVESSAKIAIAREQSQNKIEGGAL